MALASMIRAVAAAAALLLAAPANAQDYPQKAIHIIVPFPPGGVTDLAARVVGQRLYDKWGQQVLVENRAGAGGIVGVEVASRAPPDGYTLLMTTADFATINPSAYVKLPYDAERDLVPVAIVLDAPIVLIASLKSKITTVKELIAAARARPGEIAFASPGSGSTNHIVGEWLASEVGIKLLHVPYRGGAPAATAVAGGEVPLGFVALSTGLPYVNAGSVKVVGVASAERVGLAPDWPTLAEGGVPGFSASLSVGMWAPTGIAKSIVAKLHDELNHITAAQDVRDRLATLGAQPASLSTAEFDAKIKSEAARFAKIIHQAGIRIE